MPDKLRSQQHRSRLMHEVNQRHYEEALFGEKVADRVVAAMGSWRFLICQTAVIVAWVTLNTWLFVVRPWDPYPFLTMNVCLSLQAAYAAPLILLSQKRSAERDRLTLEHAAHESEEDRKDTEELRKEFREMRQLMQDQTRLLQVLVGAKVKARGPI